MLSSQLNQTCPIYRLTSPGKTLQRKRYRIEGEESDPPGGKLLVCIVCCVLGCGYYRIVRMVCPMPSRSKWHNVFSSRDYTLFLSVQSNMHPLPSDASNEGNAGEESLKRVEMIEGPCGK